MWLQWEFPALPHTYIRKRFMTILSMPDHLSKPLAWTEANRAGCMIWSTCDIYPLSPISFCCNLAICKSWKPLKLAVIFSFSYEILQSLMTPITFHSHNLPRTIWGIVNILLPKQNTSNLTKGLSLLSLLQFYILFFSDNLPSSGKSISIFRVVKKMIQREKI